MKIWAAELLLRDLTDELREKVLFPRSHVRPPFGTRRRGFEEVLVISTDSQVVVYGVGDQPDPLLNFFLQDPVLFDRVQFIKSTEACASHLVATLTGLCALYPGSVTPLAAIRKSLGAGIAAGSVGLVLEHLVVHALAAAQRVRSAAGTDAMVASLAQSAIDRIIEQVDNAYDFSWLVVGGGEIAVESVKFLAEAGFSKVSVFDPAGNIGDSFPVRHIDADELETFAGLADVVLTEKGMGGLSLDHSLRERRRKFVIDFSSSEPPVQSEADDVTVYTLDNLQSALGNAGIFHLLEEAWKLSEQEGAQLASQLQDLVNVPALRQCWNSLQKKNQNVVVPGSDLASFYRLQMMRSVSTSVVEPSLYPDRRFDANPRSFGTARFSRGWLEGHARLS